MKREKFNGLILLAGARGAGKTTIAEKLCEKHGFSILPTYTTRRKRSENEQGHIFLTNEEFDKIPEDKRLAYTEHYGDRYCTTEEQLKNYNIFIIDLPGVRYFKREYKGQKPIYTIYLDISAEEQKRRLEERGETPENIIKYLKRDEEIRKDDQMKITAGLIIENINMEGTIAQIESYIFSLGPKMTLSDRILITRATIATRIKTLIVIILNWYERFWRKEAIKEVKAKMKKSTSPELEERLAHEQKMYDIADFDRTSNNLADIFRNVKERGWY